MFLEPFFVYTPIGESIVAKFFPISISHRVIHIDIVELDMFDFDFVLRMDLINYCYAPMIVEPKRLNFNFLMSMSLGGKAKILC